MCTHYTQARSQAARKKARETSIQANLQSTNRCGLARGGDVVQVVQDVVPQIHNRRHVLHRAVECGELFNRGLVGDNAIAAIVVDRRTQFSRRPCEASIDDSLELAAAVPRQDLRIRGVVCRKKKEDITAQIRNVVGDIAHHRTDLRSMRVHHRVERVEQDHGERAADVHNLRWGAGPRCPVRRRAERRTKPVGEDERGVYGPLLILILCKRGATQGEHRDLMLLNELVEDVCCGRALAGPWRAVQDPDALPLRLHDSSLDGAHQPGVLEVPGRWMRPLRHNISECRAHGFLALHVLGGKSDVDDAQAPDNGLNQQDNREHDREQPNSRVTPDLARVRKEGNDARYEGHNRAKHKRKT
eukprot:m.151009 g.151009  ORF g.151009 m.151009 type:complete len:358 (+) comp9753_c0_seq2:64-1137(+)